MRIDSMGTVPTCPTQTYSVKPTSDSYLKYKDTQK